jgi:hypothetical protein
LPETKNDLFFAGDPELHDLYLVEEVPSRVILAVNPLVRVLRIARYPIQHAIWFPDLPNENAPIREGTVCRLTRSSEQPGDPQQLLRITYAQSLKLALDEYIARAGPHEQEILQRHRRCMFTKKRIVIRK